MNKKELQEGITRLAPWYYQVEAAPSLFTIPEDKLEERKGLIAWQHYICRNLFPMLKKLFPEPGRSAVLDFGCHCGWLSLLLREFGFARVLGADNHLRAIEQARFLAQAVGLKGVDFTLGGIEVLPDAPEFDLCLCLGMLNHVPNPVETLRKLYDTSKSHLILDCNCYVQDRELEGGERARNQIKPPHGLMTCSFGEYYTFGRGYQTFAFNYSPQAVLNMLHYSGFCNVWRMAEPVAVPDQTSYYYKRVLFMAEKHPDREYYKREIVLKKHYHESPREYLGDIKSGMANDFPRY